MSTLLAKIGDGVARLSPMQRAAGMLCFAGVIVAISATKARAGIYTCLPFVLNDARITRVDIPNPAPGGYSFWRCRADVARQLESVLRVMQSVGAVASSSGGMRAPDAAVSATRVAASHHIFGGAIDFYMYAGGVDPTRDTLLVERDDYQQRYFRVWARCAPGQGERRRILAVRGGRAAVEVEADVIDLTALMACHGLHRIPARRDSWEGIERDRGLHGGLEFWHFQIDLPIGTTYEEMLLQVHSRASLEGTSAWAVRNLRWNGGHFA